MKATYFNKPLEWNVETTGEAWKQGEVISGKLKVKNHSNETVLLNTSGIALSHSEIKKVQSRTDGALKPYLKIELDQVDIQPTQEIELDFTFPLSPNCPVTDKKSSHYISFGQNFLSSHLQIKIEPHLLFSKIIGLLDTFFRFKLKEFKSNKKGVEYKLLPPTSRDMANIESLLLTFSMEEDKLLMSFNFQIKKLDTSGITTRVNKESLLIEKVLTPKQYLLGKEYLNQDEIQKHTEEIISQVKLKAVF